MSQYSIQQPGLAKRVASGLQRRGGSGMGLRMTAMIDMIFLLLTFFVLTAKFQKPDSQLPVVMPKPATQTTGLQPTGPMQVRIMAIESGCEVVFGDEKKTTLLKENLDVGLADISNRFLAVAQRYDVPAQGIELHCDNRVPWDYVVKIYDIFYRMGAMKITFVTQEKSADSP
jgi:biopolymer transport protein ExbD